MKLKDFDFRIWHKESESFVDMNVSGTDLRIIPTDDDDDMELECVEVIGNIHENAELLKGAE